ncbi:MAG: TSUP family transporter [Clostridia bacterium]|nr:TSUP family transporter [Clostridia bacterium]
MAVNNKTMRKIVCGGAVGAANGLFGGGGGMIAVPMLSGFLGYKDKAAHATAISVIAPVCLASAAVYWAAGYADFSVIIPAALGMTAGGALGALLLNKLPLTVVKVIFIAVMFAAGVRMVL